MQSEHPESPLPASDGRTSKERFDAHVEDGRRANIDASLDGGLDAGVEGARGPAPGGERSADAPTETRSRVAHDLTNAVFAGRLRLDALRAASADGAMSAHLDALAACLDRVQAVANELRGRG
ncbi:MAG: hypothetical protein U0575_13290 [Phycisphaerales bacterium]